jgi:putative PIG3 family NAD(P)H quinone oxidoreductase
MAEFPERMKAVEITTHGGPEVLKLVDRDTPRPGPGEVLIENESTSVNRLDVFQREGVYPVPPGVTDIPGLDAAGRVVALGEGVTGIGVGDRVCALLSGGGYAEYCVAPAAACLPIPRGLDAVQASTLPETAFTVWSNVFDRAGLREGETLLVHGGSSGIGTTAIQMASGLGARVLTTAGSDEKCGFCRDLGAERAINYRTEDFVEAVREATDGQGVNVILDIVGGEYLARNVEALAVEGRLVQIALLGGADVHFNYAPVMLKRLTLTGSTLRARPPEFKGAIASNLRQHVWPLIEAGRMRPIVETVLPLSDVAEAHRLIVSGGNRGKIALRIRQ